MSKITVSFVKTGESLDIPDLAYDVLDTLVTPEGVYLAVQSRCSACGGVPCQFNPADQKDVVGGETPAEPVAAPAEAAPAAEAPAAS